MINDLIDALAPTLSPSFRNVLGGSGLRMRGDSSTTRTIATKIPVDIVNEEKILFIYAEIPGVNKETIDIDFYNNKLTITAEKIRPHDSSEISEIKFGKFERSLTLPICITKKEAVSVTMNNGILKIKINKLLEEENKFSMKPDEE
jgi:HSP20 family protein